MSVKYIQSIQQRLEKCNVLSGCLDQVKLSGNKNNVESENSMITDRHVLMLKKKIFFKPHSGNSSTL